MNSTHPQAIQAFTFKLKLLLTLRVAVRMATVWFFVWGVFVLAMRIANVRPTEWMALLGLAAVFAATALLLPEQITPAGEKSGFGNRPDC